MVLATWVVTVLFYIWQGLVLIATAKAILGTCHAVLNIPVEGFIQDLISKVRARCATWKSLRSAVRHVIVAFLNPDTRVLAYKRMSFYIRNPVEVLMMFLEHFSSQDDLPYAYWDEI